jgi:Resolvase, N terminal domain
VVSAWKLSAKLSHGISTVANGSSWPNTLRWRAASATHARSYRRPSATPRPPVRSLSLLGWTDWRAISLQERGVDFIAADMPDANRLTIHIIAAVAESVGRTISENTRTALAAAKARGVKLGNPNGARALRGKQVGNADAVAKIRANATQRAVDLAGIVQTLRATGLTSVRGLADALNEQGIRAPRGDTWHPTAVSRLLKRLTAHAANAPARTQAGER